MKTVLGSAHVVEQLSISMFLSILIFDFYLIWGNFFSFGGLNRLFSGSGKGSNSVLGSIHVVEQLSFSMLSSISTFDFCLVWVIFFSFGGPNGYFWG